MGPNTGMTRRHYFASFAVVAIMHRLSIDMVVQAESDEVQTIVAARELDISHPRNVTSASERRYFPPSWYTNKIWFVTTPDNDNECGAQPEFPNTVPPFPKDCTTCATFITLDTDSCIQYPTWAGASGGTAETMCNAKYPTTLARMLFAKSPRTPGMHYTDIVRSRYVQVRFNIQAPEYVKMERRQSDNARNTAVCRAPFGLTNTYFYYSVVASQVQVKTVAVIGDSPCLVKYGTAYYFETFGSPYKYFSTYYTAWDTTDLPGNAMDDTMTDVVIRCLD